MDVMDLRRALLISQKAEANMISENDIVHGYAISASGVVSQNSGAAYVDYIAVKDRYYTISAYNPTESWNYRLHGYNAQKQWIKQINVTNVSAGANYSYTFKPETGISYIRLSMLNRAENVTMFPTNEPT